MLTLKSFNLVVSSVLICNDAEVIGNAKQGNIFVTAGHFITWEAMQHLVESLNFNGYDAYIWKISNEEYQLTYKAR